MQPLTVCNPAVKLVPYHWPSGWGNEYIHKEWVIATGTMLPDVHCSLQLGFLIYVVADMYFGRN